MNNGKVKKGTSGAYCCVPQCKGYARTNPDLKFHRFPPIRNNMSKVLLDRNLRLRKEWVRVLKIGKDVTNYMVVCSAHFKSSDYFPTTNVQKRYLKKNVVPSLKLPSLETAERILESRRKQAVREERYASIAKKKEDSILDPLNLSSHLSEHVCEEVDGQDSDLTRDEEIAIEVLSNLSSQKGIIDDAKQVKSTGTQVCSGDLATKVQIRIESLTDKELNSLTGILSVKLLDFLTSELECSDRDRHNISLKHRIVLTMMKIKLNLSFAVLAILFGCVQSTCTSYFLDISIRLATIFEKLIYWPSKEEVMNNMPKCFKGYQSVRVVLDCTEIAIEKPKCLRCRILTYSLYKGKNTIKYLIGVSPGGTITYLSKGYGGKASDSKIVLKSNLLEMLEPYEDSVMVDKGFHIEDSCLQNAIKIIQPPFLRDKKSFSAANAIVTKKIARARVHVERAIQRVKIFQMLQVGKMPFRFLNIADKLMTIACGIVNLSNPILSDDKFF